DPAGCGPLALAAAGKTRAVSAGARNITLRLVDTATGKERCKLPPYPEAVAALAFSPGSDILAVGAEDHTVRLVDATTGDELRQIQLSEAVTALAVSPEGKTLATMHHTVRLWETATGKERAQRLPQEPWGEMAFSPDGRVLLVGDEEGTLRLYLAATGKELGRLRGHRSGITCLAFSPDGKTLASGSHDTTALLWDVSDLLDRKGEPSGELGTRQLDALWTDLAGDDAARAYQAIQELAAAPRQAVPFLNGRLRPVAAAEPKQLAALLADLDSADFAVREKATAQLEQLGEGAEPELRRALEGNPSLEVRRRVASVLQKLRKESLGRERLRELRALEVLEQIGGTEVRQLLRRLAEGLPEARLTQQARA